MSPEGYVHQPARTRAERRRDAQRIACPQCRAMVLRKIDGEGADPAEAKP